MKRVIGVILIFILQISFFLCPISVKGEESFTTYDKETISESVGLVHMSLAGELKYVSSTFIIHQDEQYSYILCEYAISSSGYVRKAYFKGTELDIELVGYDKTSDISILRFDKTLYDGKPLKLASSSYLKVGEEVTFIGSVGYNINSNEDIFGFELGHVSKNDILYCPNDYYLYDCFPLMGLDMFLTDYSYGGPIVNKYGYVVGVATSLNPSSQEENSNKLYHGTMINDVIVFVNRILAKDYQRADLGIYIKRIEDLTANQQELIRADDLKQGTVITGVKNAATLSGITINYVIVSVNGVEVKTTIDLIRELIKYEEDVVLRIKARNTNRSIKTYYVKA